jgi:para-aminobenzoate synthetase component 1
MGSLAQPHKPAPAVAGAGPERLTDSIGFQAGVEAVRARIAEGEIYQANLSHRLQCDSVQDPIDLYMTLRQNHPGPYLGFLGQERLALLSGSPELLLDFEPAANGQPARALTRPIKGTLPRGATPAEDQALAAQLLASEKDRAELTMIVDLERNDLGSMAVPGGVEVSEFPELMSFATVHHLMADVSATILPGRDAIDLLMAIFPGGSITGAPKLRSMEVIADLEREGRGFAYGSLLMIDTRGRCLANILIRTLIWRPLKQVQAGALGQVTYRVGGGITYASDAALEEAESLVKGLALARSLGAMDKSKGI